MAESYTRMAAFVIGIVVERLVSGYWNVSVRQERSGDTNVFVGYPRIYGGLDHGTQFQEDNALMKISLELSDKNEATAYPWWVIVNPQQNMRRDVDCAANQITGPYFSREEAETHLRNRHYAFSSRAVVYCMTGHESFYYRKAIDEATRLKNE